MRKSILLTFCIAFMGFTARAQRPRLTIRPEIGLSLAKTNMAFETQMLDTASSTSGKIGYQGGFTVHARIVAGLSVEVGVLYRHVQFKLSTVTLTLSKRISNVYSLNYGQIPFSINYNFDLHRIGRVFVGAGGYWQHAFSGEVIEPPKWPQVNREPRDMTFGWKRGKDFKPNDRGIMFQAGYLSPIGLFVRVRYTRGLNDLSTFEWVTYKNTAFSLSIGYDIPFIKY